MLLKLFFRIYLLIITDGIKILLFKILNRIKSVLIINMYNKELIQKDWNAIKGIYDGKKIFVLGNGPSLNKTPLYLLKNNHIMCFNHYKFLLERVNWVPEFYCCSDNLVVADVLQEIDFLKKKSKYLFLPAFHLRGEKFIIESNQSKNIHWTIPKMGKGFSENLPFNYPGSSVIIDGLQIIKHLGFTDVYLLGVDMNYVIHDTAKDMGIDSTSIVSINDDDPNHFDPRYFGVGKKYHQPEKYIIENTISDFEYIQKEIVGDDFRIINIGYDSKLNCFEKKEFCDIINLTPEEEEKIFEEIISNKTSYNSIIEFENNVPYLDDQEDIVMLNNSFITDLETGLIIYKKYIFTHLFFGPYRKKFFVYKRNEI
jgi:hypothetical protein